MRLITAVTRPATFEAIKEALALFGVHGMTVGQVIRVNPNGGQVQIYRGLKYCNDMQASLRIELLVPNDEVSDLMRVVTKIMATSDPEGGCLWNTPVDLAVRVRTGEYGLDAL